MTGIYLIKNKINNKVYIGSSVDIDRRKSQHLSELKYNHHHNKYLQRSWNKYGEDNFEFLVLEECAVELLDIREKYYIQEFKSLDANKGYNLSNLCRTMNAGTLEEMSFISDYYIDKRVFDFIYYFNEEHKELLPTYTKLTKEEKEMLFTLYCIEHIQDKDKLFYNKNLKSPDFIRRRIGILSRIGIEETKIRQHIAHLIRMGFVKETEEKYCCVLLQQFSNQDYLVANTCSNYADLFWRYYLPTIKCNECGTVCVKRTKNTTRCRNCTINNRYKIYPETARFIECVDCHKIVGLHKNNTRSIRCPECQAKKNRQTSYIITKQCVKCGELFEISTKSKRDMCDVCYKEKRREQNRLRKQKSRAKTSETLKRDKVLKP